MDTHTVNARSLDRSSIPRTDCIYASWSEPMPIAAYVDQYLASRKYAVSEGARTAILHCIAQYPGRGPYRKADMDYYLDHNVRAKVGKLPHKR
jgi:hypothetical protein